jgi:hypothetical protein
VLNQIDPADKIEADTELNEYEDTLLGVLEMEPDLCTTFLESILWRLK